MKIVLTVVMGIVVLGCGKKPPVVQPTTITVVETVPVDRPVPVRVAPPAELLAPLRVILPLFVSPLDPLASSALTVEGERLWLGIIEDLRARIRAWEAWATSP